MIGSSVFKKLGVLAVVAAGACAVPAMAQAAPVATGCAAPGCVFVGGTGATTSPVAGGKTRFVINPTGPSFECSDSRATVTTNGTSTIATTLTLANCNAAGYPYTVVCTNTPINLLSGGAGSAAARLTFGVNACTITVTGLGQGCTAKLSSGAPWNISLAVAGAVSGSHAGLSVPIAGNTTSLPFSATGAYCSIYGIPTSGTFTWSNSPNVGPIAYTEVGTTLDVS